MRLQLASDIHLETRVQPFQFRDLINPNADILALAGDIGDPASRVYAEFIAWCASSFKNVLVLHGNHELYSRDPNLTADVRIAMIDAVCARFENVVYLNNKVVTVDGVRFIGSTLWSNILPEHKDEIHMRISDYHYIYHTPKKRITPDDTLAEFIKSKTFIESAISAAVLEGLWPVVLTHHVPWTVGTSDPCYNGDALNSAFSSSLPASCDQVQLWCCGHTHYNFRHTLAGYRLVSNQLGYGGGKCTGYQEDFTEVVHRTQSYG